MAESATLNMSEQIDAIATALVKAQKEMRPAIKDADNPFFKSKYADLASVWNACREPLTNNSLAVLQATEGTGSAITIVTMLMHTSGQWICSRLPMQPVKADPQGIGSAISYGRRYGLAAMVGVVSDDDDDGEGAMGRGKDTKTNDLQYRTGDGKPRHIPPNPPAEHIKRAFKLHDDQLWDYISEEDAIKLDMLIKEVGADRDKFLAYYWTNDTEHLAKSYLVEAFEKLHKKGLDKADKEREETKQMANEFFGDEPNL